MSDVALVLGPVAFGAYEVPERIVFGGAQRLAVHQLPGGGRVIDALGRDDADLVWSGVFAGPNATGRARLLDVLRVEGGVLPLTWDVFFYSVVISEFVAEYSSPFWIPYRLRCTVLRDEAEAVVTAVAGLATLLAGDLADAALYAAGGGVDVSATQVAVGAPGAATAGGLAYAQAGESLAGTQAVIGMGVVSAEGQLAPLAADSIDGLAAIVAASGRLAALTAANGFVGRALRNLRQAGG